MGNLSLVFHVMSLFLLAALVLWVLRLQTMLKVWRDWAVRGMTGVSLWESRFVCFGNFLAQLALISRPIFRLIRSRQRVYA